MTASPSTARAVFRGLHWECPHCKMPLKRVVVPLFGRQTEVPCYGSCGCSESALDGTGVLPSERSYAKCGIPARYLRREFDLMGYQHSVPEGRSLYVHGPNGDGKSSFAGCLAKALVNLGHSVFWVNAKHLVTEIQGTYSGRQTDVLDRAYACRVLFLDDLGKEQPTAYSISMLYELVELRYGACKPIVATSNFRRDELGRRWGMADEETANAIVSRLCDGADTYEMDGEDRRLA